MAPAVAIIPVLKALQDAARFDLTVAPYWNQLVQLPERALEAGTNADIWQNIYLSTNPLISGFAFSLAISPIFLVISEILRNYSQVDCFWSILPTVYAVHYAVWAHLSGLPTARVDSAMAALLIWSARLTFNYWRKGGYSWGAEDYRWEIIQKAVPRWAFFLFNVTFISTIQSILLFAITTPIYLILLTSRHNTEMGTIDNLFASAIVGLVAFTAFADQQQWNYYGAREIYRKTAKVPQGFKRDDLERGFNTTGLFALSRHPNFAAEQAIWCVLYQWGCWSTRSYSNWTSIGAISYLILFQGSTWFTEKISTEKYPEYKVYQKRVGRFLPKISSAWNDPVPDTTNEPPAKNTRSAKKRVD